MSEAKRWLSETLIPLVGVILFISILGAFMHVSENIKEQGLKSIVEDAWCGEKGCEGEE